MPKPDVMERKLVAALTEARQNQSLTFADVADRTGLHRTAISLIERGERHMTLLVFLKICAALKIDPASLFDDIAAHEPAAKPTLRPATVHVPTLHEEKRVLKKDDKKK